MIYPGIISYEVNLNLPLNNYHMLQSATSRGLELLDAGYSVTPYYFSES
jgi:hypothetical protein